jgi:hypothetical protein
MAQRNISYTIPKWVTELTPQPKKYLTSILRGVAFAKMKEYEKQLQVFQAKYKIPFTEFEKKTSTQKKEQFELWDDYIVWKGLVEAQNKWLKRYQEL